MSGYDWSHITEFDPTKSSPTFNFRYDSGINSTNPNVPKVSAAVAPHTAAFSFDDSVPPGAAFFSMYFSFAVK